MIVSLDMGVGDEIPRSRPHVLRAQVRGVAGAATVTLYAPGRVQVWSGPASWVGDTLEAALPATATATAEPGDGWDVDWQIGDLPPISRAVSVVLYLASPALTVERLLVLAPTLGERGEATLERLEAQIGEAWREVRGRLRAIGRRPELILGDGALDEAHKCLALATVYRSLTTGGRDSDEAHHAEIYQAKAEAAWQALRLTHADPKTWQRSAPSGVAHARIGPPATGGWR